MKISNDPAEGKPRAPSPGRGWSRPGGALTGASLLALVFCGLAFLVVDGRANGFDNAVLLAFRTHGNPADPVGPAWLEEFGRDVTALGSYAFTGFVAAATTGFLLLLRKNGLALLMAVSFVGGAAISTLLKLVFERSRPDIPNAVRVFTASFPSSHATLSAVTFLTVGVLLMRVSSDHRIKAYFIALAVFLTAAVGVSRLYLGVHYPTDVLAGWSIGGAWALSCGSVAGWLQHRPTRPPLVGREG
jgi:undecaprenyl-diphosphatase